METPWHPPRETFPGAAGDDAARGQLVRWLALPTPREQRRFLETHLHLLAPESEGLLMEELRRTGGQPAETQRLREALRVLQDARARGGTVQAIREAYVNTSGGFALDLPAWLETLGQQLVELKRVQPAYQTGARRRELVQAALTCAHDHAGLAPEALATLHAELALAWFETAYGDFTSVLEAAYHESQAALAVYTLERYPRQYAAIHNVLGRICQSRQVGEARANIEQAIACQHEALRVWTPEAFPYEYAQTQCYLGWAYFRLRMAGERRENLERGLACYRQALGILTLEAFPSEYAHAQNGLGAIYLERLAGERRTNLEQAIASFRQALRVFTPETSPIDYTHLQNNLGNAYWQRLAGTRRENVEQAITCYQQALQVLDRESFPYLAAIYQANLGVVYQHRLAGERQANLEQAIAFFQQALRVLTPESYARESAETHLRLGNVYQERLVGGRQDNLEQALACYHQALRVYTLHSFPEQHRSVQLACAEVQAQRSEWPAIHEAYVAAHEAEDLLVALGAGAVGRDVILKEGRDAHARDGFALARLGRLEEAAVSIERGRARGLAEALQFNAADPALINDEGRRARYIEMRQAFVDAQAALHAPPSRELDDDGRLDLERIAAYRAAKADFDALVAEIRAAGDPADFLGDTFAASSILAAAGRCGSGHALVYLAATPWGGLAVAAFAAHPGLQAPAHFAAFDLPALTTDLLGELLETHLGDDADRVTGGFACALQGSAFDRLRAWPGQTLREHTEALHAACQEASHAGTLDLAAQELLAIPALLPLVDRPLDTFNEAGTALLRGTLAYLLLQHELERCLGRLGEVAVRPMTAWLRAGGAASLSLIPCGQLSAFPLGAVPLADGRTLIETLPVSLAPSARSLWRNPGTVPESTIQRQGLYALGNPAPTPQELRWGEAEALTLARLADQLGLPAQSRVQWQATRDWLLTALKSGLVVDASCHGRFDLTDFLRSRLLLANQKEVTLAELLSYRIDMRGLRLLILSACQTALLDLSGARDEVRSLAAGMLQAGARAVLATLWPVDDKATYLLMVRFAQEWLPRMTQEAPAAALARAQRWLRTVTNQDLQLWQASIAQAYQPLASATSSAAPALEPAAVLPGVPAEQLVAVRGGGVRFDTMQAQERIRETAEEGPPEACPYADPYYWAAFQLIGW